MKVPKPSGKGQYAATLSPVTFRAVPFGSSASVCCAIINSSSVGTTRSEMRLSGCEMSDLPSAVLGGSAELMDAEPEIDFRLPVSGVAAQPHLSVIATSPGIPPGKSMISTLSLYPRGRKYFAQS